MAAEICSKCGAAMTPGQLGVKGSIWKLGFKPDSSGLFSRRSEVLAFACPACGYLELHTATTNEKRDAAGNE